VVDLNAEPQEDTYDWRAVADKPLPPGQHLAKKFPHLEYASIPKDVGDPYEWTVNLYGAVSDAGPATLRTLIEDFEIVQDFRQDFHCITGWSLFDLQWQGFRCSDLMDYVDVRPEAVSVMVQGRDEFSTSLKIEDFADGLLAVGYGGKPLSPKHGFPVRFIAPPHLYQFKSCKWVTGIEFMTAHKMGFWEIRAYSDSALVAENDRYANPETAKLTAGQIRRPFEKK